MRIIVAIVVGIVMIVATASSFVLMRPVERRVMDGLNTTIYNMSITSLTTSWDTLYTTVSYLWWLIPIGVALIYILYVWLVSQEKEYVTAGVYS